MIDEENISGDCDCTIIPLKTDEIPTEYYKSPSLSKIIRESYIMAMFYFFDIPVDLIEKSQLALVSISIDGTEYVEKWDKEVNEIYLIKEAVESYCK